MITITGLGKFYGKKTLFENVSLTVDHGEKIGLIGPNGAGKTTLFRIITGEQEAANGNVYIDPGLRIGYLSQESNFSSGRTVLQEVIEGDPQIEALKKEKEALEHSGDTASHRYGQVQHELEHLGIFDIEYKAKQVLAGLEFKQRDFNRPISEMSGGWQMRALLARLLVCKYDFLLLDEPTNYLDLKAALWFKDYLASYDGAFIMISHDRAFLDDVTNYSVILENGKMTKIKGNYEQYRKLQDEKRGYLEKQFNEQERQRKQLEEFVMRFHAQPNKAAQVRNKRKQLERMEEIVVPQDRRASIANFQFPQSPHSGYRTIALKKVSKSYGDLQIYKDLDFEIIKGEKAVLYGDNGAGKSTLLKILADVIDFDSGTRQLGHNVSLGYFSQTRLDVLNPESTVLEEALRSNRSLKPEQVRTLLGVFLFTGDDVEKRVKVLSGGEKSRLIMAKLIIECPNFLLLDEPTTHLDVDAVEALIKALNEYNGTVVFISHDIHFVRSVANNVYEVNNGHVRKFPGTLDYYLEKSKEPSFVPSQTPNVAHAKPAPVAPVNVVSKDEHNFKLSNTIKNLRKKQEKLKSDRYAKERIASDARHGEEIVAEYALAVKNLDKEISAIDAKITELKAKFIV